MNLADTHAELAKQLAHNLDSASYSYVDAQVKALEQRGENPADYSLVSITEPQYLLADNVEMRVTWELRIVKTSELKAAAHG